jgi:hypothetical protein
MARSPRNEAHDDDEAAAAAAADDARAAAERTAATVTVACSLPHGLILQCYRMNSPPMPPEAIGDAVTIAGANAENAAHGYGYTERVDESFWRAWLAQNQHMAAVRRGLLFAADTPERARDQAREQSAIPTGFGGLNPDRPAPGIVPFVAS